ncbi:hypothetical protein YW7DRAFT_00853 [Streptomyces sp. AmelKG-E11A]|nr:hypothetical protein YW7DRAFT_00853 [Streptomyces sp. AmelKG-E11A]
MRRYDFSISNSARRCSSQSVASEAHSNSSRLGEKNRRSSCAVISCLNRGYAVRSIEVTTRHRPQTTLNITTNGTGPNGWRATNAQGFKIPHCPFDAYLGHTPTGHLPYGATHTGHLPYGATHTGHLPYGATHTGHLPYGATHTGHLLYRATHWYGVSVVRSVRVARVVVGSWPFRAAFRLRRRRSIPLRRRRSSGGAR